MDKDMDVTTDQDSEMDASSTEFVFASPSIISSPERLTNFNAQSFTFAKPAFIEPQVFPVTENEMIFSSPAPEVVNFNSVNQSSIFSTANANIPTDNQSILTHSISKPVSDSPFNVKEESRKSDENPFLVKDANKKLNENPFTAKDATKKSDDNPFAVKDTNKKLDDNPFVSKEVNKSSDENPFKAKDSSKKSDENPFMVKATNKKSDENSFKVKDMNKESNNVPFGHKDTGNKSESTSFTEDVFEISEDENSSPLPTKVIKKTLDRKSTPKVVKEIKRTSAFVRLEENAKKSREHRTDRLEISKSIACLDVPDSLLHKTKAREYFDQFGEVLKIVIRTRKRTIIVYYTTDSGKIKAYSKAGEYLGEEFTVQETTDEILAKSKKKETTPKGIVSSFLNLDDEVKEELAAMRGLEYNLHNTEQQNHNKALTAAAKAKVKNAMVVANKQAPKRATASVKPILKTAKTLASSAPPTTAKALSTSRPLAVAKTLTTAKPVVTTEKPVIKIDSAVNQNLKKISLATIEELQNQIRQAGTTAEEKYKILDARDRLMRLKQQKQQNLATAKVTKGSCPDMCPEKERYMREFQRQVASYEQVDSGEYKINHIKAVKQYSRSSADQEEPMAHDLRPVKSLKMTMSYLLHEIANLCEHEDANLEEWYHFLWDRMRSIRKDITQQELCCLDTVELMEQCTRFHILASERLCAEEASVFDPKINSENLTKCLQTLKYMYDDLRGSNATCKNEPEFRAYVILLNLNNSTFISDLRALDESVQQSAEIKFALDVYSTMAMDNYSKFFKLVRKATYLNGCILLRYFNQVRLKAINVMVKAYCRASGITEYPLYELIDILGFEDENEVFEFCSRVGLKYNDESLYIKLKKENLHEPDSPLEQGRAYNLVLSKRKISVGECTAGGALPERSYENHKPHNSFSAQGYLLPQSRNAQDQNPTKDVYAFEEDDVDLVSESKRTTSSGSSTVSNNLDEKKAAAVDASRSARSSFVFKKPESAAASKPAAIPKATPFTRPAAAPSALPSIFSKPPPPPPSIFSKPPPPPPSIFAAPQQQKAPPAVPPGAQFGMAVNKSIFSGGGQANLFKPPKQETATLSVTSGSTSERSPQQQQQQTAKRRLEDADEEQRAAEKRSLLEKEEQLRKKLELQRQIKLEKEKLARLQKINSLSAEEYERLKDEVIEDVCSSLVHAEVERIKLTSALSEQILDGLFRELCEQVLDEQLFVQDMLLEVERRLRDKLATKYCLIWKRWAAKRRAQRREALDNTPVWLQPESLEQRARRLYHPEQKVAIRCARETKRRRRRSLVVGEEGEKHTPIAFIINVGLKENAKSLDVEMNQPAYWKLVVCWPLLENRLALWRHKKAIDSYLSPDELSIGPICIQHKPNPCETFNICICRFEGLICEKQLVGMDALLFVASGDEDARAIEARLNKSVLSRGKLMPIPLVILVFGENARDPDNAALTAAIEKLSEAGYVAEYTILKEKSADESVMIKVVQSATLWLAINRSPAVPLEMDCLKRLLDDCLTEEFWLRIQGHMAPNPKLAKALNDPNFIVGLHNEAVNHITDIILDPESMLYTDFATELKIYLSKEHTYPCTYEYFDAVWKHPEYRAELERIMSSFVFPPWRSAWPIANMMDFHDAVANYCSQIVTREAALSITSNILSDLFLIAGQSEDYRPSFADVLIHLMNKKIHDLGGNARVVYNKNHVKHFQTLPWWFKSSVLLDYMTREQEEERVVESTSLTQTQDMPDLSAQMDFEYECDIDELSKTYHEMDQVLPVEVICEQARDKLTDVELAAQQLEKQLEEQRLKNESFEEKLKRALYEEDDDDILLDVKRS